MKNTEIKMALQRMQKTKKMTEEEKRILNRDLDMILKYFDNLKKEKPNITIDEMKDLFFEEQYQTLMKFSENANLEGKFFQYKAAKTLLKDKKKLKEVYEKVENQNNKSLDDIYNSDDEHSLEVLVKEMIKALENRSISSYTRVFGEKYKKQSEKEKKKIMEGLSKEDRDILKQYIATTSDDNVQNVYNLIEYINPELEEGLKDNLIQTMECMGEFFDRFGLIEIYEKAQTAELRGIYLKELEVPLYQDKFGKKEIEINKLFSEEYLRQFDIDDLLVLNAFWQNRFAKASEKVNNAFFAVSELEIIDSGKQYNYLDEDYLLIKMKTNFLKSISDVISVKIQNKIQNEKQENCRVFDANEISENMLEPFAKEYDEIISSMTVGKENNLVSDYNKYAVLHNQLQNSYIGKDSMLINILDWLWDNKGIGNWGCINEKDNDKANSKYVLLGIDYEGMNMPVRLHMEKDFLKKFLITHTGKTIMPVYEGSEDFFVRKKLVTTNVLMPVSNKHKKVINDAIQKNTYDRETVNFLEHLLYIKDRSKYPNHLKEKKIVNGKEILVIPPKKYINIVTGEEVKENKIKKEKEEIANGR